jgi:D-glycero-D-manno-heptose 1,7-bisphosphate phosphatase
MTIFENIDLTDCNTLFLDRDGIINQLKPDDYVKTWDEFKFIPGILEALSRWSNQCKYIFIVTNQRGVGKGLMKEESLIEIHEKMLNIINMHNGRIDKIYYCVDVEETSYNRKPNIGMAMQAINDFPDINLSASVMIGDSESDMLFAKRLGVKGIQIQVI